jgi:endopeptidase La
MEKSKTQRNILKRKLDHTTNLVSGTIFTNGLSMVSNLKSRPKRKYNQSDDEDEEDDEEDDDDEDMDEEDESDTEHDSNSGTSDSSDSGSDSGSDSESDDSENDSTNKNINPNTWALNLLKKKYRHNKKLSNKAIAKIYSNTVIKMDSKYKSMSAQSKEKTEYKKTLEACKELDNKLKDSIEQLKSKFKLKDFIEQQENKRRNTGNDFGSAGLTGSLGPITIKDNKSTKDNKDNKDKKDDFNKAMDEMIFTILFTDPNLFGSSNIMLDNYGNFSGNKDGEDGDEECEDDECEECDEFCEEGCDHVKSKKQDDSKNVGKMDKEFEELYDQDNITTQNGLKYFKTLTPEKKRLYLEKLKQVKHAFKEEEKRPNYMKILDCETTESNKALILQKITTFDNLKGSSEFFKLKSWINKIMRVPFGKYVKPPVAKTDGSEKIREYLKGVRKHLDDGIYGHETTKDQLIKILAHTITNPQEGGNVFALQGPPGVGKTALIQDGVAKALGRPYSFISLGGATDACFLEGHDYTYEGSNHGRIVELLQQAGCMNPVIYFDELDKVSETAKGEEIINILMHITDSTQNSHFNDKYFGGLDFDLSKAIIIFSFNDEQKISRILRDRMKIIRVKGYKMLDKLNIAKDYLIPKLIKQIGLEDIKIEFSDEILTWMIDTYTNEGGVRRLKELINDILLEINLRKLEDSKINGDKISSQIVITQQMLTDDLLKKKRKIEHLKINPESKVGIVNGLWANELGVGGLIPIECCWIPSTDKLQLELTGMQGKVMKESMSVARTIAWRILPDEVKSAINARWKDTFDYGIHIHCPDGATPKDGPSAGGAITTCLISLLSGIPCDNHVAMTGEINLKGHITAIGGLEEKIFGAKKAGAKLVLCPKENSHDLDEIKSKFANLFNEDFKVIMVENIWQVLDIVLTKKLDWVRFD